jgi:hypothetical protein
MTANILSQEHLLKELSKKNSRYRNALLNKADRKLITAVCEVIHNTLEGNIPINSALKELLSNKRNLLRKLVQKNSIVYKKKLLIQQGGFILPLLLPAALTAIASAIFG